MRSDTQDYPIHGRSQWRLRLGVGKVEHSRRELCYPLSEGRNAVETRVQVSYGRSTNTLLCLQMRAELDR
jgi:hypothetical protein